MRILLLQDIKSVGQKGQIKNVSDGHARNFLIPKGLAKPATPGEVEAVLQTHEQMVELTAKQKEILTELKKRTESAPVPVLMKVGKKGEMFTSVREPDIFRALLDYEPRLNSFDVRVEIEKPIKEMGEHGAVVSLGRGVREGFTIEVKPETT